MGLLVCDARISRFPATPVQHPTLARTSSEPIDALVDPHSTTFAEEEVWKQLILEPVIGSRESLGIRFLFHELRDGDF